MSKEVNEIINNLCDKLGTSAKYLIPEMARMHIAQGAFMSILSLAVFGACIYFARAAWAYDHRGGDSMWDNDSCWTVLPMLIGLASFICLVDAVYALLGWLASPTAMAIREISGMIK